ncbi:MAG: AMP-binding protein, partial [Nitrospiraceae bacterium]|nr:AMP-binding protein [Nitrospiraceae bacterium]
KIAKKHSGKTAFIDCTSGRSISYFKALSSSLALSRYLEKYEEKAIGIMLPTTAGCALSVIGVLMSGRVPVMINYSTGAANNARYAQGKCFFKTVITSRSFIEKIDCPFVEGMVFIEDIIKGLSVFEKLRAAALAMLPLPVVLRAVHGGQESDNAAILFTSGSEKEARAVQLTHRNIISNINGFSEAFALSSKDSMLASLPYFHIFGFNPNLWTPLYHGMTIISYANPVDYKKLCEIIRDEKPTIIMGTPSFFWGYLRKSDPGDFRSVRIAVCGADKCPGELRAGFAQKHNITLYEGYGATETSPVISANTPANNKPGSVGRALPNVSIRVENHETGEECPTGTTGRILVKGELVMKGYLGGDEETSGCVRDGWYDTGDMGYLDEDGYLWFDGRLKRFVKIGGEMVSLVKVEEAMGKVLPEGVFCCVVSIPDIIKGQRIVAAVTEKVDEMKMIRHLMGHLPNIAIPKQFTVLPDLPKTGTGKIDFRKAAEMVRQETSS